MAQLNYKPDGITLKDFLKNDNFFRGIRGPVGSGKSVACCIEVFKRSLQQEPNHEGKRKSRWAVIRNTNPQLKTTTIKTWLDWFPEHEWGAFRWSIPYTHHIILGDIDLEVIFLALDRPEDVKKLLSLELTGVWVNEARELPKSIIDACTMRVGRFPSMREGGATWYGVIADSNAPEEDHWWAIMAGDVPTPDHLTRDEALMLVKPDSWTFFTQPSAMTEKKEKDGSLLGYDPNISCENKKNLTENYYNNIIKGKTKGWIDVYVMNKLGTIEEGKPVYPNWNQEIHLSKEPIPIAPLPVFIGIDFGLTPAAVFGQKMPNGRWLILQELVCFDMGISRFSNLLKHEIAKNYKGYDVDIYGDPSGDFRAQTDETTPFQILRQNGLRGKPAPSNDIALRIESVETALGRLIDKKAGFLLDNRCINLKKGFNGGYYYRRLQTSGNRYDEKPYKNRYSHIHDALQYMMMGAGEGKQLIAGKAKKPTVVKTRGWNIFDKKTRRSIWQNKMNG
jgi:hypothetical protein|tara:strand:- start:308 stop:1825 length:1518 start_codon:yes stop_codon:yes gene_type:complete